MKSFLGQVGLITLAGSIILTTQNAFGATYTVSNYTQLRDRMATVANGDIILVNPGTYKPTDIVEGLYSLSYSNGGVNRRMAPRFALINKSNITIKAANSTNKPRLQGEGIDDDRYILYAQKANGLKIENIIFENARIAIVADRSDNISIRYNLIQNTGEEAIHLRDGSDGARIANNTIKNVGYNRKDRGEGIYICNDKKKWHPNYTVGRKDDIYQKNCDNTIIENNVIGPNIGAELIDIKEGVSGTIVRNNTFNAAITDTSLINASGDFTKSLIHDKGYNSRIHNNTFNMKNVIWFDTSSSYPAIRVEQVLTTTTDTGWNLFGHSGKYVYNKVTNGTGREYVVISPSYGGTNAKVGCDQNGTFKRYKVFSKSKSGLKIDGNDGNTGASVVSGTTCNQYVTN